MKNILLKIVTMLIVYFLIPLSSTASQETKVYYFNGYEEGANSSDFDELGTTYPNVWFWRYSSNKWGVGNTKLSHAKTIDLFHEPQKMGDLIYSDGGMMSCSMFSKETSELKDALNDPNKEVKVFLDIDKDYRMIIHEISGIRYELLSINDYIVADSENSRPYFTFNSKGEMHIKFVPRYKLYTKMDYKKNYGIIPNKIPFVQPGFGMNVYAIYDRYYNHKYGMGRGVINSDINDEYYNSDRIPYNSISLVGSDGYIDETVTLNETLKPDILPDGKEEGVKRPAEKLRIGRGTFINGGAIGYNFIYPIAVYYSIEDKDSGTIPAEYITEAGQILKTEQVKKSKEQGTYSYTFGQEHQSYSFLASQIILEDNTIVNKTASISCESAEEIDGKKVIKIQGIYKGNPTTPIDETANFTPGELINSKAILKSNEPSQEIFDVSLGIPTTEYLYANILTPVYIGDYKTKRNTGSVSYDTTVKVTYNLKWTEERSRTVYSSCSKGCKSKKVDGKTVKYCDGNHKSTERYTVTLTDTQHRDYNYSISRDYSYTTIDALRIYDLVSGTVSNESLPGGNITLNPQGYTSPTVESNNSSNLSDHIIPPNERTFYESVSVSGSSIPSGQNFRSIAESELGPIQVRNDHVVFNGQILLNGNTYYETSSIEGQSLPESPLIGNKVLYKDGLMIPKDILNGIKDTTATVIYKKIHDVPGNSESNFTLPVKQSNNITIHTPVVTYGEIYDDENFDQQIQSKDDTSSFILGRPNMLTYTLAGQHRSILGYGNRDYAKYTENKQVKFPFDVYMGQDTSGVFLPKNTWYELDQDDENYNIYIPIWVDEGDYKVTYRSIAINANTGLYDEKEDSSNRDMDNYVAYKEIDVRVVGRLYGFTLMDIYNYPLWQSVFRKNDDSEEHSGTYYYSGYKNRDGYALDDSSPNVIPLIPGSHPEYENKGPIKLGYSFKYKLNTIGNYFNNGDGVYLKPKFYYVDKQGNNRQEIDLYYHANKDNKQYKFIKLGSEQEKDLKLYPMRISLFDNYRSVPESELQDTANILGLTMDAFKDKTAFLGYLYQQVLTKYVRTFIGDTSDIPSSVDDNRVKKSIQQYYGEYFLPSRLYAVQKDFDINKAFMDSGNYGLTGKEDYFLKEGYIIINFDITTFKDQNIKDGILTYKTSDTGANMWDIEDYQHNRVDSAGNSFEFLSGDIILYYTDYSSIDDYKVKGTH